MNNAMVGLMQLTKQGPGRIPCGVLEVGSPASKTCSRAGQPETMPRPAIAQAPDALGNLVQPSWSPADVTACAAIPESGFPKG